MNRHGIALAFFMQRKEVTPGSCSPLASIVWTLAKCESLSMATAVSACPPYKADGRGSQRASVIPPLGSAAQQGLDLGSGLDHRQIKGDADRYKESTQAERPQHNSLDFER